MVVDSSIYYDFYEYRLDVENEQLLKNGETVQLTHKAFQILHLLVQNSGQITKKEDIFNQLWTDSFVEDANLTQHIYVLRKALGRTPNGQSYIETVPKQGYRFTLLPEQIIKKNSFTDIPIISNQFSDLSMEKDSSEFIPELENHSRQPNLKNSTTETSPVGRAKKPVSEKAGTISSGWLLSKPLPISLLLVIFGLSVAAVYFFQSRQEDPLAVQNIKSIAVLPFKPIGEEVDREKLGFGIADAVITRLSNLQRIEVRPTSSVFRYADQPAQDAASAGRALRVDAILEGTVQCDGERVRVSVQLVRVSDGKPLWAETFHEKISDLFSVQDSISSKVASTLSLNLNEQQKQILVRHPTTSTEAFQAYQMGVYFWNRRRKEDLQKAVEYFQKAVQIDSAYAQAYAKLADAYSMLAYYRYADIEEMKPKARDAAEKALSLDDSLAEAHIALALVYAIKKENFAKAQELLERAVSLDPYNATARHRHGWILLMNGKLDEGVREIHLAREYDPLSAATNRAYCGVLIMQRNFDEAVKECESTFEIYVGTPNSRRALARAYFYTGKQTEALNQLEIQLKSGNEDEKFFARGSLAYFYTKLGRHNEAEKIYADLKKEFDQKKGFARHPQQASELALISFELGKKDEAAFYFMEMSKLLDEYADLTLSLYYEPFWDEMKKDQQFAILFPK